MTPKEKAEDLFTQYYSYLKANLMNDKEAWEDAKVCALMSVENMLEMANTYDMHNADKPTHIFTFNRVLYLQEVKQEIEKL